MTYLENFRRVNELCRICTTYSEKISYFHHEIAPSESSSTVLEALEKVLSVKINDDTSYPKIICKSCCDRLRLRYDFKDIFNKSQRILEKYLYLNTYLHDLRSTEQNDVIKLDAHSITDKLSFDNDISDNGEDGCPESGELTKYNSNKLNRSVAHKQKNQTVSEKADVKVNIRSIEKPQLRCTSCTKKCLSEDLLEEHLKICTATGTFECDFCISRFDTRKLKSMHMRYNHKEREYKCDQCNAIFHSSGTVWYHRNRVHGNKIFPCKICGKAFNMKNSRNKHLMTHNRDEPKVVCQICGKGFHYDSGLFYHMRVHQNIRNYICTFCPKRFLTMSGLKRHMRTHTGERPYYCSFCAKSFSSLAEVKTHERRHTGYKPYMCIYCKKHYISLYNLKMHMSTHTGMYPCDICSKSYLNAHVLKLHMKYKHNIKDDVKLDEVVECSSSKN